MTVGSFLATGAGDGEGRQQFLPPKEGPRQWADRGRPRRRLGQGERAMYDEVMQPCCGSGQEGYYT